MINITPDPIAIQIGPLPIFWYGIAYALGLAVAYLILVRQARHFGQDPELIGNGIIVIAVAALIGGRLYHVIDQWSLYADNPLTIILPPYSGLGVYGGLITGILAFIALVRYHRINPWVWADIVAPALFAMQAIGRWGNFFNQELFGPPTNLPWGIAIDCDHRLTDHGTVAYPCSQFPEATTGFHPLFLYESISGLAGLLFLLWLSRRRPYPLRPGDQILIFFIWYAVVRFALETLRSGNWVVGGIPTAQIISILFALGAFLILIYRHRRPMVDEVVIVTPRAAARAAKPADPFDDELDDEGFDDDIDDEEAATERDAQSAADDDRGTTEVDAAAEGAREPDAGDPPPRPPA
jgi:phosphatidylglycerol:prolipoprotein diacylglycerol transferase